MAKCPRCDGKGMVTCSRRKGKGVEIVLVVATQNCPKCYGKGEVRCPRCGGTGKA
jgi:DnaJ-class molecular chaperone